MSKITASEIVQQLETYSNAIVAFSVLQALTYSYSFGTSELFNCLIKTANYLAAGLTASFTLVAVLLVVALLFISRTVQSLAGEYTSLVKKVYRAKIVAVILASAMPAALTAGYGLLDYEGKERCEHSSPISTAP